MVNINIYLLDRNLNICNTLSSNGDVNSSPFFNDVYKQVLETGVETFEFESMQLDYLENCNYVAFEYKGDLKLFQISEIEDTHEDNLVKRVYCEMAGVELTYEIIRPRIIQSANIKQFLEILLSDTSWNVGYIDEDITDVFTIEISDFEKIYDVIQENIKLFECEIVFRVEKENGIFKKYIDAYKSRGDITNYRFEYSKNIQGISRTVNSFELVTALIGVGKDDLTFKSCEWSKSNGDPIDKPKGQDYIVDESAFRLYNNNGSHLMGYYKCDLDTPYDLLNATYKELKERNTPKVDYEVDITLIDDEANIGDTVYVIDNDWQPTPLHLSARISQLEISFTDKTKNKCTLSNYNRVKSKIKDDLNEILNRIPEDTSFMGISKGGLLSSSIEVNGYRLQIKNKLTDKNGKEYFFRLKDKTSTSFMNNILTKDPKYVTQSFAIDFDESCIYTTQSITETDPHHILITKMNFTGDILGYMRLHGFGHGSQIGIDKIDGVTKIWCECEGRPHTDTGRLYGTKICRFEFVDGAEYTNSTGSVYDIIPNARNIQVAISEETNRLSVKYITYDNKNGFKVFDLRSVLNNRPRVLASFLIPNWLEDSINPNQGHSVYENRIYHYQGGDSQSAEARITVLDFRGNVLDSNIIKDGIGFTNREPEGLYLRCNNGIYELYAGISEGAWPNRKYHIYKYYEGLGSEYEKRGTFIHNNGHSTDIYETIIDTNLDGTARRKEYLIYSSNKTSQFIIGSFKNGSWWVNNELYTPEVNDAIIAELIESDNAMEIILLTNDFESIKGENGQDGSPGQDAIFLELTNEFHSVPTDADGNGGIYAGCETELRLYKGDVQLTDNISYSIKNTSNITGKLDGDKYTVTNLTKDTGYVDLVATYFGKEYIKRFSVSKNKQGLGGEDGLTPTVYWLMTSTSTISKDSKGNLKPSSVTFWAKSQTGEDSVVNYQGIFKIYESIDGNIFTLKHTSELDDAFPYTPSSTAQSIKCELYLNDGTTLIDQDIVNIVKDGTDGFSGADAKYVLLTGEQIFKYTNNFTGTPTPSSITLTGTPFNISSSNAKWYYKKSSDTNYTLISANNGKMEFTLNHNDSTLFANNNKVVTIKFDIDGYYDEMTIAKISDGSSGSDGEDGYFVLLTNENHTVPCENDGTVVNGELEKAKTEIHVFKGTQEVSFSLSKTDVGCTSTYDSSTKTLSITSLTSKAATVTMQITVNGTVFTKVMTISKATKGDTGEDSYTVDMTNDNYSFNCDAKGNIASVITTTTVITAFKGVNPVVPTIGTLPTVAGLTLSKSNGIITIKANTGTSLADNGSFDIPVTVGGNNFIKTFSWTKVKNGSNGSDGISVTSTDVEYAQNTSATTAPTTGWTTTAPTWTNGKYIWSRTKTVLSSGTTKYTNPACITGQQGNSGATGTGISSITEEYYLSTSKTTQTGGSWVATPPTWSTGKYMWTRSKIVYNNPTSTVYTTPICDSSWEAVNEIEIGGRNFVRYSDKFRAVAGANGITSKVNSDGSLSITCTADNGNWYTAWYDENFNKDGILDLNFKEGDIYTISFTIKSDDTTRIPTIYIKSGMGYYTMRGTISSKYSTIYYTGVWKDANYIQPHLGFNGIAGTFTIKNWKIEKGNKPTTWTSAPEDIEKEISDVSSSLGSLEGSIKDAFGDGIINDSEARALASNIQILNNEMYDIDKEYSTIYNNTNLGGSAKTNLYNAKNDYNSTHTSLISSINTAIADKIITDSERNSVNSFFSTYRTKLQTLRQRLQEANDYISTNKVDNIQIGGRNIFLNSSFTNNLDKWSFQSTSPTFTTKDNKKCAKISGALKSSRSIYQGISGKLEPNTTYTMSGWVYTENIVKGETNFILSYYIDGYYDNNGTSTWFGCGQKALTLNSNKWVYLTWTFTTDSRISTSTSILAYLYARDFTGDVYFYNLKLEKGNKPTDWTPAPEDVDSTIGKNIKTVDVMYYLSTSQTSLTGGSWQTTAPTWVNGKYMWSKTVTTLANGTVKESSPTCIAGAKGDTGSAGKGVKSIVEQYYLSTSQTSLSGGSWSTTVPTWQQGKYIWTRSVITYTDNTTTTTNGICVSGSKGDKGDKGDAGTNGTNGVNGTSPVLVTISGQQSMKYLDKTSAPTPSTITLTANVMEGNVVVSSGITYIWQYKNSSGTWVNLSGTYTSKTYSLAHNNTGFVNEVAQIRVAVSYKSKTYYLEHTVTKIYDNKYISKQEVFDKITEGGTNQLIYKDPSTGEIYINATFIKTGQLVADLIKGGILTLGGTGNSDTGDYGRFRILDSTGQNELASMDGGEMRMVNLQAEELNATNLNVKNINCATYAPAIYEYTKVYVNTTSGNDEVEFESGAVFKTLQGALDSAPKNLNGFTTEIVLQTAVSENIVIRGFSGGTLNILMNSKNINGYVVARDCSAQVFILGGLTTTDIPDGINNTGLRPNIQPSQLFSFGGYNYSFVAIGCPFVYVRSVDIFGKTGTTTNYCGGSVNGSNVYVQNVNAYASNSGWNVTTGGKMTTKETYGRCERLAYNVQLGGVAHICNGNSTGAPSNIYTGNGGQVVQGNVTFVGSGDVGSNDNTTTNSTSVTLNASSGDSYKVKYSSWRKDNSVRQGDWSSTGMNKGCWFFGNQFADLKGKTIKSVKLTLQRQSGGNSGAVTFTLKMHNHTGRPSGVPSYLSEWSKNISLTVGQSTTITITDSAVLTAIKNGTMKGFGIEVSSTSNSYYGILTPKLKAVVTY